MIPLSKRMDDVYVLVQSAMEGETDEELNEYYEYILGTCEEARDLIKSIEEQGGGIELSTFCRQLKI